MKFWFSYQSYGDQSYRLPRTLLVVGTILSVVLVEALRIVSFRVAQRDVRFVLVLLHVQRFVQVVVDHMVFGGLGADVVGCWWHADEMDLMEGESFRADPGVLLVLLAVVEHFAVETFVGVVAGRSGKLVCF